MIIDDHEILAQSLVRLLGDDPGLQVLGTEATASAGIERATAERPDVVIMDYSLPDMDGASATRCLKQALPDQKVVMLTGSERPGAYAAAMEAGCAAWIRKTRAIHELLEVVHRVAAGENVPTGDYEDGLPPLAELVVHYQPVVELVNRSVVGFEALVRWQHPREGVLLPPRFLSLAEETGYMTDIGKHVTGHVLEDLAAWHMLPTSKSPPLWVSINMSAVGIADPDIVRRLVDDVAAKGLDPACVVIEITESALLADTPVIAENIGALKEVGLKIALDDFGTAFSSLSYLLRVPFDHVKIDTSFTAELPHSPRSVLLVESIGRLALNMGATGIAEGIERPEQARSLMGAGWQFGQGFLYERAVPFDQASELARTRQVPT